MSNVAPPPPSPPEPSRPSQNNTGTALIVAGIVVAVIVGFVAIGVMVGNPSRSSAISTEPTTPSVTVTSPPVSSPPPTTPSNLPPLQCLPAPPPPKHPKQYAKPPNASLSQNATWQATLATNCGKIVIDLNGKAAPQTVASFIFLTQQKFYDLTPCHRLTTAEQGLSVLQCGDPTGNGSGGPGYGYGIENAPPTGKYPTGTVAMARTNDPNSNGSQFFIVYADTTLPTTGGGYSIFGHVVQGLPIVQAIAARGLASDGTAPAQPISIVSATVKKL